MIKTHSSGSVGEKSAQFHFNLLGWRMFRSQPEAKIGGIADFTGYNSSGFYIACEVKEASGDSMPCSRIDKAQRDWLASLPVYTAYVRIYWKDKDKFTIHQFKCSGSYSFKE